MLKRITSLLIVVFMLSLFAGCASVPAAEPVQSAPAPVATPTPAPEPTPTPDPGPDLYELSQKFSDAWKNRTLSLEFPEKFFGNKTDKYIMNIKLDRTWLVELARNVNSELAFAAKRSLPECGYKTVVNISDFNITWQMVYALTSNAQDEFDAVNRIILAAEPAAEFTYADGTVTVNIAPKDIKYKEMLSLGGSEDASFAFSYASTLFDENGDVCEYILPEAEGNLKSGIVWPLESHTRLRKTWYADRDGGKRRHTGTDIWANKGVEIYSCTDGTVTGVYYEKRSGNAVVVTDEYGYEFHCYHMYKLTDFLAVGDKVKAGDVVGYVGSTGNSACNHLHLTIVADNGVFINPYPYLEPIEP